MSDIHGRAHNTGEIWTLSLPLGRAGLKMTPGTRIVFRVPRGLSCVGFEATVPYTYFARTIVHCWKLFLLQGNCMLMRSHAWKKKPIFLKYVSLENCVFVFIGMYIGPTQAPPQCWKPHEGNRMLSDYARLCVETQLHVDGSSVASTGWPSFFIIAGRPPLRCAVFSKKQSSQPIIKWVRHFYSGCKLLSD